jgi:hypothetical protein
MEREKQTLQKFVESCLVTQIKLQRIVDNSDEEAVLKAGEKPAVHEITLASQAQTSSKLLTNVSDTAKRYRQMKDQHHKL